MSQSNLTNSSTEETPQGKRGCARKLGIAFAILIGIVVLLWGLLWLDFRSLNSEQEVAGQITISNDWIELTPKEPLKPSKDKQEIVLDSAEPLIRNNSDLKKIQLENGTVVKPELQLIDQYGNIFNADVLRYPTPSLYNNGISCYVPRLPQERAYTKVRVRCDQPLKLARIVWHCHKGK